MRSGCSVLCFLDGCRCLLKILSLTVSRRQSVWYFCPSFVMRVDPHDSWCTSLLQQSCTLVYAARFRKLYHRVLFNLRHGATHIWHANLWCSFDAVVSFCHHNCTALSCLGFCNSLTHFQVFTIMNPLQVGPAFSWKICIHIYIHHLRNHAFLALLQCIGGSFDSHATYMVPAIHIYHLVCFHCTKDDYFHHFVFAGIICPLGFYFKAGPIQNAVGFFICGLPGGLDYVMLALVKHKMMQPLTEKKYNARINVWLRSPGLLFCAFSIWVAAPRPISAGLLLGALVVALNGQYYMQMVVGNTFIKTRSDGADPYNC